MDRRQFIRNSTVAMASLTSAEAARAATEQQETSPTANEAGVIGRPVRVASIGFKPGPSLEHIAGLVEQKAARGTDLITLPETFRGQNDKSLESLDGPTVSTLAPLGGEASDVYRGADGPERRRPAAELGGHSGSPRANRWGYTTRCTRSGWKSSPPRHVQPGQNVTVIQTDFGRLGVAICFDVNWAGLWQRLSDFGAELVIWPSAYSAGRTLQARAIDYSYYIMSATYTPDCLVFDLDGEQLVHDKANQGDFNITRHVFDLDRCIPYQDLNRPGKIEQVAQRAR